MNKDLTVGKPQTVLWAFCLPLFGSIVFQQLYNIADSLVAGKFVGEDALAAVGNSYEITLIFIAFAFGCNIGSSVIVSQFFGAKKYAEVKTAARTAIISSTVLCILLMLAGGLGSEALLHAINTPENVFADSLLYLKIYVWGLPFVFLYNIATGIFSALGTARPPSISWRPPPPPTSRWISSLSPPSKWVWPAWPGPPSCARGSAASWL